MASYPTPRQRRLLWTALSTFALIALVGTAALIFFILVGFLSWSYPVLLPLGVAVIVALVLDPLVNFLENHVGLGRRHGTLVVCLLAVLAFIAFWAYLLPPLVQQSGAFFASIQKGINTVSVEMQDFLDPHPAAPPTPPLPAPGNPRTPPPPVPPPKAVPGTVQAEIQNWLKANLPQMQQNLPQNIGKLLLATLAPVGHAFGFMLGFGFVPIYVYYLLADKKYFWGHWHEYVPLRRTWLRDEVISVLSEIFGSLNAYLRGQIIVAGCNGLLTFIGLTVIGIPYSLVLGVIAGTLSIVPFLGIIASIVPALILAFLSSHDNATQQWLRPLLVVVVFTVVQMCESLFITPRVQSQSTGLHPLAIILGILFWSLLLPGLLGPIVAVPLTCAMMVLLRRYVWKEQPPEEEEKLV